MTEFYLIFDYLFNSSIDFLELIIRLHLKLYISKIKNLTYHQFSPYHYVTYISAELPNPVLRHRKFLLGNLHIP